MLVECRKLIRVTNDKRMIINGVIKTFDEEKTFLLENLFFII